LGNPQKTRMCSHTSTIPYTNKRLSKVPANFYPSVAYDYISLVYISYAYATANEAMFLLGMLNKNKGDKFRLALEFSVLGKYHVPNRKKRFCNF